MNKDERQKIIEARTVQIENKIEAAREIHNEIMVLLAELQALIVEGQEDGDDGQTV